MKSKTKKLLLLHGGVLLGIGVYAAVLMLAKIHCPFRAITGVPCPTCGFTRALLALLRGDLMGSLRLHPMLIPVVVSVLLFLHAGPLKLPRKGMTVLLIAVAVATFGFYVFRLLTHTLPA